MSFTPALFEPMPAGAAVGTAYVTFSEVRSAHRSTTMIFGVAVAALATAVMLVAAVLVVF